MAGRRGLEGGLRITLATGILVTACGKAPRTPDAAPPLVTSTAVFETNSGLDPFSEEVVVDDQVVTTGATSTAQISATPIPTAERVATPEPLRLENPFQHVFNQRCQVIDNKGNWKFKCIEAWAGEPLPGGSLNPAKNYLGSSTCNAAATTDVINQMVPPEVINRVIGVPGIDPMMLVYGVYENLPDGQGFKMSSNGAGFEKIVPALHLFGLEARVVKSLSWYSLPDFYRTLKPGQKLMLALIGTNSKGKRFQHYTVVNGVDENGEVFFRDSFFYEDPKRAETDFGYREHVYFQDSGNIMNDSTSPIGKRVDIVGAAIIEPGDFSATKKLIDVNLLLQRSISGIDYQIEFARNRSEYLIGERNLNLSELEFSGQPVILGNNRYRIGVKYKGSSFNYYYYDPDGGGDLPELNKLLWYRWGDYLIPLLKQTDPEWAGLPIKRPGVDGAAYQFGKKGCGPAVAASILSMMRSGENGKMVDPYLVYESYFPNLVGGAGTYPKDYVPIFENSGLVTERIDSSKRAVLEAAFSGKIVVVQGAIDFKWGTSGRVNHFILVLPPGEDGTVQIFDPIWGVGVTELDDVDFGQSSGVFVINYPGQ